MAPRSAEPQPDQRRPAITLVDFLRTEAGGGVLLLVALAVALVWASSSVGDSYISFWSREAFGGLGPFPRLDVREVVNEGLMTLFFLVVSLEIRREFAGGELSDRRSAALPLIAALGGVVMPALVFLTLNGGGDAARGWAIPMATDIAFVAGALALAGRTVPASLKAFLIALAIADDIAAIVVIAVFYTGDIGVAPLAVAVVAIGILLALRRSKVRSLIPYVVVAIGLWGAFLAAGIHATLAGVVLAATLPSRGTGRSPIEVMEDRLNEWSSLAIVPLFALANAGLDLSELSFGSIFDSRVVLGVSLGLIVGKPLGIAAGAALAIRFGVARMPDGVRWLQLAGAAALAGIGFTVSLFVASLSFGPALLSQARLGILIGSVVSCAIGILLLQRAK